MAAGRVCWVRRLAGVADRGENLFGREVMDRRPVEPVPSGDGIAGVPSERIETRGARALLSPDSGAIDDRAPRAGSREAANLALDRPALQVGRALPLCRARKRRRVRSGREAMLDHIEEGFVRPGDDERKLKRLRMLAREFERAGPFEFA